MVASFLHVWHLVGNAVPCGGFVGLLDWSDKLCSYMGNDPSLYHVGHLEGAKW